MGWPVRLMRTMRRSANTTATRTGGAAAIFPAASQRRWWRPEPFCCLPFPGWASQWERIFCAAASAWDRPFDRVEEDIAALHEAEFPALEPGAAEAISRQILAARDEQDSVGGVTQTAVCGLPAGVGEPWFDSVESLLSHAVFSVGGIKGIEFGSGFSGSSQHGSQFNDALRMDEGRVVTQTNHNGGVNGGITNGMPVVFQCAVKPTPSIARKQQTVDFLRGENAELTIHGRHDPAIIRRICPVLDSVTALVLCDLLAQRFGTDYFTRGMGK